MTDNASAGATPAVAGATPAQTPASPAPAAPAAPTTPATGADDGLGDAGKRALHAEREARTAAERERNELRARLEELENASKSDAEKAIAAARKEGGAEVLAKVQDRVRRTEVRAALQAAGITPSVMDLAARADQFSALKVNDEGEVAGLEDAVKAFREAMPDLFPKTQAAPRTGDFGGGARGKAAAGAGDMNSVIRRAAGRG